MGRRRRHCRHRPGLVRLERRNDEGPLSSFPSFFLLKKKPLSSPSLPSLPTDRPTVDHFLPHLLLSSSSSSSRLRLFRTKHRPVGRAPARTHKRTTPRRKEGKIDSPFFLSLKHSR
mmetsp:Transcript_30781/g.99233  ORF Transcript_30781/g.99233 Transcript_30781/m.99233 type:complete len:116 (-) Transcript_30781:1699-2046(-)